MKEYVAVYGTLRYGQSNAHFLRGSRLVGQYRIQGWNLYGAGAEYPYAVPGETGDAIMVELYEITPKTLRNLDGLEGYPNHYDRRQILVGLHLAWIYFTSKMPPGKPDRIHSGDWLVEQMGHC